MNREGNMPGRPNIDQIMSQIRADVRAELEKVENDSRPPFLRAADSKPASATPVLYSEELNYLNANWNNWVAGTQVASHRPFIGPVIVRVKKFILDLFWGALGGYFEREREFHMNLVRFLNSTARYIDARDAEIFWQLVQKFDNDLAAVNERLDRMYDEAMATIRTFELDFSKRIATLETDRDMLVEVGTRLREQVGELDTLIRSVERTVAVATKPLITDLGQASSSNKLPISISGNGSNENGVNDGIDYLLLENRYRGSEELIKSRLADYLPYFRSAKGVVIDLGCGRGEFLELLGKAGIEAYGVDLNEAMIALCQSKNLPVSLANCLGYLEQVEDGSLGGIFASQLVEHLTRQELDQLLGLAARKLRPDAPILLETINPASLIALSSNFFRDPTHVWPLHPDTLRFMMEMRGLRTGETLLRSPFPEAATLRKVEVSPALPARWRVTLEAINQNIDRLNGILFGSQDFCAIGFGDPALMSRMQRGVTTANITTSSVLGEGSGVAPRLLS